MTRILVLSDIHGNLTALETVLDHAAGEYDALWCLGDVVGYGPRPNECVELMQAQATLCVVGNHDWAALGRDGVDVESFNPIARDAILWTRDQLSATSHAYLDGLPAEPVRIEGAGDFLVTHASPREPVWEYILTPSIAMENFSVFHEPICLVGHTHKPVIFRWRLFAGEQPPATLDVGTEELYTEDSYTEDSYTDDPDAESLNPESLNPERPDSNESGSSVRDTGEPGLEIAEQDEINQGVATVDMLQPVEDEPIRLVTSTTQRLILNPGSVGQPRDNDARAAYAIMDLEAQSWCYRRVEYPIELTQSQMRAAGLPKRLIDRLSFGW